MRNGSICIIFYPIALRTLLQSHARYEHVPHRLNLSYLHVPYHIHAVSTQLESRFSKSQYLTGTQNNVTTC